MREQIQKLLPFAIVFELFVDVLEFTARKLATVPEVPAINRIGLTSCLTLRDKKLL